MARIPDITALDTRSLRTARGIVSDQSAEITANAEAKFAGSIRNIAGEITEKDDRFNYASAKSEFLQADIDTRKAIEDTPWQDHEAQYEKIMGLAIEKAGKQIRSRRDRSMFELESKTDLARGREAIRGRAKIKERDWGRSSLDQSLEANRAAALNADDEASRSAIIGASKDAIIGAKEKGYLSEQEATDQFQRWRDSYVLGTLEMQTPEQRIESLNKPGVADYLQPDVKAKLLEQAKRESHDLRVRRESQAQEDAIVSKFGTGSEALTAARKIDDPEVRDSTVSRIKARDTEARQQEIETRDALGEEALAFINEGGRFADLPLRIKNGLKPSTLSSLKSFSESGKRSTAPETLVSLSSQFADDPQAFGETDLLQYRDKLSDNDFEKFVDLQRKVRSGNVDGKTSGFQSLTQVRDTRLRELFGGTTAKGDKQKRINDFVMKFEAELGAFKEETGKNPKAADARKILDNLTSEVSIDWGSDKKVYELKDGDIPEVPSADRAEIIRELQKRGKPVTDEAIVNLYKMVNK